jgi:hypothetical protein
MSPHTILSLVHVFVFAPLLAIIAKTSWIPHMVVAAIGGFISLYHGYKAFIRLSAGQAAWVNLIHALFVGPVLVYKGLSDPGAPRWTSEIILMFAFAAFGYHAYYLLNPSL